MSFVQGKGREGKGTPISSSSSFFFFLFSSEGLTAGDGATYFPLRAKGCEDQRNPYFVT